FTMPSDLTAGRDVPPGLVRSIFVVFLVFALLLVALSVTWLIYFNRRNVKAQFAVDAETGFLRGRPLSITIIGWLLIAGASSIPIALVFPSPLFLFGLVIRGWPGKALILLLGLVSLLSGFGLLRMRRQAHSLAVAYYGVLLAGMAADFII